MPTGYTAKLYDGDEDFKDFVLKCATAFLGEFYDRDINTPIPPHTETSTYLTERLEQLYKDKASLESLNKTALGAAARSHKRTLINKATADIETSRQRKARYEDMLKQVEHWQPPTDTHQKLKEFMVEQLNSSMSDGDTSWQERRLQDAKSITPESYKRDKLREIEMSIAGTKQEIARQSERIDVRNRYVEQLFESLGVSV